MKKVLLVALCFPVFGCVSVPKEASTTTTAAVAVEGGQRRPASEEITTSAPTAAHDALNKMGAHLRGQEKGVHYLGMSQDGELCEVWIRDGFFGYIRTNKGSFVSADSVYNPYYAITEEKSEIESDSISVDPSSGIETAAVSVSSGIDNSRADLIVRHNKSMGQPKERFISGAFKFRRGSSSNETCDLRLEMLDRSTGNQPVLVELRMDSSK